MQMKQKKLLIVVGSICLCLVVFATIFALVFRLKTVDVEFRYRAETNSKLADGTLEAVEVSGEFEIGKNIVFMNFDDNIKKIEKANPFIKVEQIIRYFPNVVRVYVSERIPRYRVKDSTSNNWYILDVDFKILDMVSQSDLKPEEAANYFNHTIEISEQTLTFESKNAIVGEFADDGTKIYLAEITAGMYGKTKDHTVVRKIDYSAVNNTFTITMRNSSLESHEGCRVVLNGTDDLYNKALRAAVCFNDGQVVIDETKRFENDPSVLVEIYKGSDGKYVASAKKI